MYIYYVYVYHLGYQGTCIEYHCARSPNSLRNPRGEKQCREKLYVSKKLNQRCPARLHLIENSGKATLHGCLAHNHPDNPTMKKVPWVTKRQIAKHLVRLH